jgi:DNA repair protein RadC
MKYDYVAERTGPETRIRNPEDLRPLLKKYANKRQEHFLVVILAGDHCVTRVRLAGIGLANRCLCHPREIFRPAIVDNATAVILAHNHPSGNLEASDEDRQVTRRMVEAGELLGIAVLDHVIIGKSGIVSLAQQGLINRPRSAW